MALPILEVLLLLEGVVLAIFDGVVLWAKAVKNFSSMYINLSSMKQEDKGGVNFNLRLIVSEFASKEAARLSMDRIEWRVVLVTALKET